VCAFFSNRTLVWWWVRAEVISRNRVQNLPESPSATPHHHIHNSRLRAEQVDPSSGFWLVCTGSNFDSPPGQELPWLRRFAVSLYPGKCWHRASSRSLTLPNTSSSSRSTLIVGSVDKYYVT
jgi:hypothetical protein